MIHFFSDTEMPAKKSVKCPYGPTNTYTVKTPLGNMVLTCCPNGLHTLGMAEEVTDESFSPQQQ